MITPATTPARDQRTLGDRVRQLRTKRNMSVRTLATEAGFSPSFLSQVENDHVSPSIASLERIAAALGLTLGALFQEHASSVPSVIRMEARRKLASRWSRAKLEALGPVARGRAFEVVMITIAPGGSSGKRPGVHLGEEFAFLLNGRARLTLGDDVHLLGRGDAVTFDSDTPHLWENTGLVPTRLLLVSSRSAT